MPRSSLLFAATFLFAVGTIATISFGVTKNGIFAENRGAASAPTRSIENLTATDLEGNTVSLSSFVGSPFLINLWATWCPYCISELKDFTTLAAEGNFPLVLAVNRGESKETVEKFMHELGIDSNISSRILFLRDPDDTLYHSLHGYAMPETLFVNEAGIIVLHRRGFMEQDVMKEQVKKLFPSLTGVIQ